MAQPTARWSFIYRLAIKDDQLKLSQDEIVKSWYTHENLVRRRFKHVWTTVELQNESEQRWWRFLYPENWNGFDNIRQDGQRINAYPMRKSANERFAIQTAQESKDRSFLSFQGSAKTSFPEPESSKPTSTSRLTTQKSRILPTKHSFRSSKTLAKRKTSFTEPLFPGLTKMKIINPAITADATPSSVKSPHPVGNLFNVNLPTALNRKESPLELATPSCGQTPKRQSKKISTSDCRGSSNRRQFQRYSQDTSIAAALVNLPETPSSYEDLTPFSASRNTLGFYSSSPTTPCPPGPRSQQRHSLHSNTSLDRSLSIPAPPSSISWTHKLHRPEKHGNSCTLTNRINERLDDVFHGEPGRHKLSWTRAEGSGCSSPQDFDESPGLYTDNKTAFQKTWEPVLGRDDDGQPFYSTINSKPKAYSNFVGHRGSTVNEVQNYFGLKFAQLELTNGHLQIWAEPRQNQNYSDTEKSLERAFQFLFCWSTDRVMKPMNLFLDEWIDLEHRNQLGRYNIPKPRKPVTKNSFMKETRDMYLGSKNRPLRQPV